LTSSEFSAPFLMAFQPIVNAQTRAVFAYEALVRGPEGEPAQAILDLLTPANRPAFDRACRAQAMLEAHQLGLENHLCINFLPETIFHPEADIAYTMRIAQDCAIPPERLIFEVVDTGQRMDLLHLQRIFRAYQRTGVQVAMDLTDLAEGSADLDLLDLLQPDMVKLDVHQILKTPDSRSPRLVGETVARICQSYAIRFVAEGVESLEEWQAFRELGVELFQGFLCAIPETRRLPPPSKRCLDNAGTRA
jgi:EAL domain-containing protein (putative c-di-GMP-specific phosphodiesterase class I)